MKILILIASIVMLFGCQESQLSQSARNKEIVAKAFEIVGSGDYAKMNQVIAENYVRHCQATPDLVIESLSQFKEFIRQDREAIPDQQLKVKHLVAEGNLVAFFATYMGTQTGPLGPFPASNKFGTLEFAGVHRLENDKIVETWITWDNMALLTQLGHFPPSQNVPETTEPNGI